MGLLRPCLPSCSDRLKGQPSISHLFVCSGSWAGGVPRPEGSIWGWGWWLRLLGSPQGCRGRRPLLHETSFCQGHVPGGEGGEAGGPDRPPSGRVTIVLGPARLLVGVEMGGCSLRGPLYQGLGAPQRASDPLPASTGSEKNWPSLCGQGGAGSASLPSGRAPVS